MNIKRSVTINGHRTSVTLEKEFWESLKEIARKRKTSVPTLISEIDEAHPGNNLSSAIRVFVLKFYKPVEAEA